MQRNSNAYNNRAKLRLSGGPHVLTTRTPIVYHGYDRTIQKCENLAGDTRPSYTRRQGGRHTATRRRYGYISICVFSGMLAAVRTLCSYILCYTIVVYMPSASVIGNLINTGVFSQYPSGFYKSLQRQSSPG